MNVESNVKFGQEVDLICVIYFICPANVSIYLGYLSYILHNYFSLIYYHFSYILIIYGHFGVQKCSIMLG